MCRGFYNFEENYKCCGCGFTIEKTEKEKQLEKTEKEKQLEKATKTPKNKIDKNYVTIK